MCGSIARCLSMVRWRWCVQETHVLALLVCGVCLHCTQTTQIYIQSRLSAKRARVRMWVYVGILCRLDFTAITSRTQKTSICRYSEDIQQFGIVYHLLEMYDNHLFVDRSHTLSWLSYHYSSMDGWIVIKLRRERYFNCLPILSCVARYLNQYLILIAWDLFVICLVDLLNNAARSSLIINIYHNYLPI